MPCRDAPYRNYCICSPLALSTPTHHDRIHAMRWGIRPGEDTVSLPLSLYYVMVVGRCMCRNNRDQPEHQSQHLDTALRSGLQPLVFACTVFHTDAPQIRSQKRSLGSPQAPHHLVYYTGQYCTIQNISSSLSTLFGHPGVKCIRQHCKSNIVDTFNSLLLLYLSYSYLQV